MPQSSKKHNSSTKLMKRCWNWWRKTSLPSRVSQINSHLNRTAMRHMTQNPFWLLWNERHSQKSKRKPKWKSSWEQRWKRQISRLVKALWKNINSDQKMKLFLNQQTRINCGVSWQNMSSRTLKNLRWMGVVGHFTQLRHLIFTLFDMNHWTEVLGFLFRNF